MSQLSLYLCVGDCAIVTFMRVVMTMINNEGIDMDGHMMMVMMSHIRWLHGRVVRTSDSQLQG